MLIFQYLVVIFCWVFIFAHEPILASAQEKAWEKEWEKSIEAAKKEGRLTLNVSRGPDWHAIFGEFRKEYPEIQVLSVRGSGSQNATRILAERRANKNLSDIWSGSPRSAYRLLYKARSLDPIKDAFILPEVVDQSKWFEGKHRFVDPEGRYIFVYTGGPGGLPISYNSKLVNPKEFKSYRELVNPKWKSKIVAIDPRISLVTVQFFYYNPLLGPGFIKQLYGEMDVTISRDFRQLTDWLARGRFPLCVGCRDVDKAKSQGLPVEEFDKRGWDEGQVFSAGGGTLNLVKQAPHPNAARVFVNWFLSRKGQRFYQQLGRPSEPYNSLRTDIPKDIVPESNRLFEGVSYMDMTRLEYDRTPVVKLINRILRTK